MALTITARLNSRPEATTDGSGCISHDFDTRWVRDADPEKPIVHKTVDIPASVIEAMAALPVNQRVAAYLAAIRDYFFYQKLPLAQPSAPSDFQSDTLLAWVDVWDAWKVDFDVANDDADAWGNAAGNFIESQPAFDGYPFTFTLYP